MSAGDSVDEIEWSQRELEEMSPIQRAAHAGLTGKALIVLGVLFLAMGILATMR